MIIERGCKWINAVPSEDLMVILLSLAKELMTSERQRGSSTTDLRLFITARLLKQIDDIVEVCRARVKLMIRNLACKRKLRMRENREKSGVRTCRERFRLFPLPL
jgi:hypothetical protein